MNMRNKILAIPSICINTLLFACLFVSCIPDSINIDPDKILQDELNKDNLWGSYLTSMQRSVVPEDNNLFQRTEDLWGNMHSGYFAGQQNWEGGYNGTTYVLSVPDWINSPFQSAFVEFLSSWNILRQKVDSTSVLFAVGEILKVEAMHKTTDIYGPIPYKKFGLVSPVPYDSQEEVYKSFFKELNHAIDILTDFDHATPNSNALEEFDLIYNSHIPQWIRFANSLKLRLAIRTQKVLPDAKKMAEEAVSHEYGVIEVNTDNAMMASNSSHGFTYYNPIYSISNDDGYGEDCMGATMDSYLNGFKDPRLPVYFLPNNKGEYRGLRNGHKNGNIFKEDAGLSKPNIPQGMAYPWMTAAEVYFLRAEGATLSWDMKGTAQELYEMGIRRSFEQHAVAGVENYLKSTNKPAAYPGYKTSPGIGASSDITVAWNEERKLEQIITQKWIAMYPLGQEAWTEFRRTGYPKIFPVIDNLSNGTVNTNIQLRRVVFPESEYTGNRAEVEKAILLLKGPDEGGTRLWWDVAE